MTCPKSDLSFCLSRTVLLPSTFSSVHLKSNKPPFSPFIRLVCFYSFPSLFLFRQLNPQESAIMVDQVLNGVSIRSVVSQLPQCHLLIFPSQFPFLFNCFIGESAIECTPTLRDRWRRGCFAGNSLLCFPCYCAVFSPCILTSSLGYVLYMLAEWQLKTFAVPCGYCDL